MDEQDITGPSVKRMLMELIADEIDETSLRGVDSFVEMSNRVIHCSAGGRDFYFEVSLIPADESDYFRT